MAVMRRAGFKAIIVDRDSYLLELGRYVQLNPVRLKSQRLKNGREQVGLLGNYG